ncbi:hypothetical protein [Mycolicibacterium frederiksbergense]|uniref:hypothetical protein n=1 Tax=Mycolicibacterium frederiksbergense TaxID=117567 RepID=UPI00265BB726|nr:hypothetical protein [Mycolicibacterium frederiksbergense]MBX9920386.1 hypothetical protein [Mycolicibacterium frederiksbergense]MDO0973074.1 hypothetical protein [Mycolicibacterium frederiksbergense]
MPRRRVIVWGPGEVGAAVIAGVLADRDLELVGVKAFNPAKEGRDAGELVGVGPCGVLVTCSSEDLLTIDADVVVLSCAASALDQDLDADVIAMLQSGKNVIATVGYHHVARSNPMSKRRQSPQRLQQAALAGNASLYGAGVHPSYMTERVAMTLAAGLGDVEHIRTIEALDFSGAPADMWGGLAAIGFGSDPGSISSDNMLARYGDMYYGDTVANLAFSLTGSDNVRIENQVFGRPATSRMELPTITIEEGTVGALHLVTKAFVGSACVATNEEVWFLGAPNAFRGDDLPFENWNQGLVAYTIEVSSKATKLRAQLEYELLQLHNPVTQMSVRAVIDAIGPVCDAEPGVLIDDATPRVRRDPRVGVSPESPGGYAT